MLKKLLLALVLAAPAAAQDITNHAVPVGKGAGVVGFGSVGPCTAGQTLLWVSGTGADPSCGSPTVSQSLTSAHIFVGNGSNVAADVALSGDCTIANTGAITCTKTNGSNFATIATSGSASDLGTGTLPYARLSLANTHVLVGNGSNIPADVALSGDCSIANTGAITCTKTSGTSFVTSATTDTTNASNISSGTLAAARGGAGTITGALKGDGAGVVTQANCAALSDAAASCSTDATNASNISSGSLAIARIGAIATNTVLSNVTAGTTAPLANTVTAILDTISSTQGTILYRNASAWVALATDTDGKVLTTHGAGANPTWTSVAGTGTVTEAIIAAGSGIAVTGTCDITTTGTCTVAINPPVSVANGGTGRTTIATHSLIIAQGASAVANTGTGTTGQCVVSQGASSDPQFISGCKVLLNTLTASNSASLQDTTSLTSTYNEYEIVFEDILPATNGAGCLFQVHASSAYQTTSYINAGVLDGAGGAVGAIAVNTNSVNCSANGSTDTTSNPLNTGNGITGRFRVHGPTASVIHTFVGSFGHVRAAGGMIWYSLSGAWNSATAIDGFQVSFNTGNITSGKVKIYGIP